jgi:drug/metabolite transporter (DMT)-like permease
MPEIAQAQRAGNGVTYGLLCLSALFWAGSVIVGRAVADEVPPMALNFWRWVLAFVCIAPFGLAALWRARDAVRRHWVLLTMLAVFNSAAFGSLLFLALQLTEAVNGSLLIGSMPINIVLVSLVILHIRITRLQTIGVALGFAGIVTIVCRGDPGVVTALSFNVGDLVLWLGVLAYAVYSIYLPRARQAFELIPLMTVLFALGSLVCLPLYLWETVVQGTHLPLNWTSAWSIAFMGIFPSLLAQVFWAFAVPRVGANTAGYFIYLAPVFGTVAAILLLGEQFFWFHALGIALIFAGIFLATRSAAPR